MLRVSAVMAVYNAEHTVVQAVESALAQSFDDPSSGRLTELIVVDDASTDATLAALQRIGDPRVQVLRHDDNLGPAAARNCAASTASGDVIAFIDADDMWMPRKLELQCRALSDNPDAAVAYGWADVVDGSGRFVYADARPRFDGEVYAQLLQKNFIFSGSNVVVRRAAFEDVGGFDPRLRAVEDWELNARLAARYQFRCVPQVVVHYRQTVDSLSGQLQTMETAFALASKSVFEAAPAELQSLRRDAEASFYVYLATRAAHAGWRPARLVAFVKYAARALSLRPSVFLDVLKGASPFAPLRLAAREFSKAKAR